MYTFHIMQILDISSNLLFNQWELFLPEVPST